MTGTAKALASIRAEVADACAALSDEAIAGAFEGELGALHRIFAERINLGRPVGEGDCEYARILAQRLSETLAAGQWLGPLLGAMLYHRIYDLPGRPVLADIPPWHLQQHMAYACNPALYLEGFDEARTFFIYMRDWVADLHRAIIGNPESVFWRQIAIYFGQYINFLPLYLSDENLRDTYRQRAEIIEHVLRINRLPVDFRFVARPPGRRIRLGILAQHFGPSAETFASLPVYEFQGDDFEIVLYAMVHTGTESERYCRSRVAAFKILPPNLPDQVAAIRADDLDILYLATNVTAFATPICLLAMHRLARRQVTSVGSVTTTGIRNIDYYISGKMSECTENASHYTERLLWLSGPAQCFSYGALQNSPRVRVDRSSLGIAEDAIVYASAANVFKLTPELLDAWARVLGSVPHSVLMLFPYGPNWSSYFPKEAFQRAFERILSNRSVDVDRVLIMEPRPAPSREDIREYMKVADVYLDSFPLSGTTSLVEPLEAAVPVIVRDGATFRASMGGGILKSMQMPDLIAADDEAYVELAVRLGIDSALRAEMRGRVADQMRRGPRFLDSRAYAREMADLLRSIL